MYWIASMFFMLAIELVAICAIAAAVETVSPGAIRRLERRLGFSEEDRGWEVPKWK